MHAAGTSSRHAAKTRRLQSHGRPSLGSCPSATMASRHAACHKPYACGSRDSPLLTRGFGSPPHPPNDAQAAFRWRVPASRGAAGVPRRAPVQGSPRGCEFHSSSETVHDRNTMPGMSPRGRTPRGTSMKRSGCTSWIPAGSAGRHDRKGDDGKLGGLGPWGGSVPTTRPWGWTFSSRAGRPKKSESLVVASMRTRTGRDRGMDDRRRGIAWGGSQPCERFGSCGACSVASPCGAIQRTTYGKPDAVKPPVRLMRSEAGSGD